MNKIILIICVLLCLFQVTCKKNEKFKLFNSSIGIDNNKSNGKEINEYPISDVMKFLSMGFNTKDEVINTQDDEIVYYTNYYFYGYKDYSEALINENSISLSTGEPGAFYPYALLGHNLGPIVYERYNTGTQSVVGYIHYAYATGFFIEEHEEIDGKLVYWALKDTFEIFFSSDNIEQKEDEIIVHLNGESVIYQYRYYNISQKELLDIFLNRYLDFICNVNKFILNENIDTDKLDDVLIPLLQGRTARELEIFRNCLFAKKGLKFQTQIWTDFFNEYLNGYNGKYTNEEVMAMFTNNEKYLLDLIKKYENRI
jgi:hypothetical protein